jgi:hypothetical protein
MMAVGKRTRAGPLDAGKKTWQYKTPSPHYSWTAEEKEEEEEDSDRRGRRRRWRFY